MLYSGASNKGPSDNNLFTKDISNFPKSVYAIIAIHFNFRKEDNLLTRSQSVLYLGVPL